ncbi:MAG: MBL fold hydrolase [Rhodospirillaceae bacterium]|nr:MBL fold hydrolase [Rhodospirillaceae bacterium]
MKKSELVFVPLGGAAEIGMNMNLYHFDGKWLMVDLGIAFGDDSTPGIDVLVPDPSFIEARREDLVGLVVTHGHEDHIGGIPYLWDRLRCPIYATPFTASLIRRKLSEAGLQPRAEVIEMTAADRITVAPFDLELVSLTHSIPEPNGLILRCGKYTVWHTGDWKFDTDPQIGEKTDLTALVRLAEQGVTAMVCDSTNADIPGETGSEGSLLGSLTKLFARQRGKIAVACFASNVARLRTIALAAKNNERHVALVGRSLWRIYEVAKEHGYLLDVPAFLSEKDVGFLPDNKTVMICTGSQGEPRAALSRIADNSHPQVSLTQGDVLIFSSRQIPGNEKAISRMQSKLLGRGVNIITGQNSHVHVSGHPSREEMVVMYQTIKPEIAIPVHGEARHLSAHAAIAKECQVPQVVVPENGSVVRLAPGSAEVIFNVETHNLAVDGKRLTRLDSAVIRDRRKLLYNGSVLLTVILDRKGFCADPPIITVIGVPLDFKDDFEGGIISLLQGEINSSVYEERCSDEFIKALTTKLVKRSIRETYGKQPMISIHLIRS